MPQDVLDVATGEEAGTLCIMVGGDQATYDRCKPVLDLMGDKAMYCGALGSGAVCKIVNNLIGMSVSVLLSEAFTLGTKAGVDPMTLYEVIRKSSGNTQTMQTFPQELFVGNFEPGFMLDLGSKDLGLATQLARSLRVPMNMGNLAHQRYIEAQNAGYGRQSIFAVTKIQEGIAGVEVRTTR
jgi:3-hydroxyisobutyrate dehydrogenase-like beta-hydroxyacid dehydrogenase